MWISDKLLKEGALLTRVHIWPAYENESRPFFERQSLFLIVTKL